MTGRPPAKAELGRRNGIQMNPDLLTEDLKKKRLLELIREFDARGGWSNGFASCAAWLT